jgi:hypothetical protein
MDLQAILTEWEVECKLGNNLDEESRNTPSLHAKYLSYLTTAKLKYKQLEHKQKTLLHFKWLYYNGKMSKEEIEAQGWEYDPFNGIKVLKSDMNTWYESDKDLQKSEEILQYYKTIIETLKEIVDALKWRHQTIKNIIEYRKFESGV